MGTKLVFEEGLRAEVIERTDEGGRVLRFAAESGKSPDEIIASAGAGSAASVYLSEAGGPQSATRLFMRPPRARRPRRPPGCILRRNLLERIRARGIGTVFVTLHVGIATFRPVRTENIAEHEMHTEEFEISEESAEAINSAKGKDRLCRHDNRARIWRPPPSASAG